MVFSHSQTPLLWFYLHLLLFSINYNIHKTASSWVWRSFAVSTNNAVSSAYNRIKRLIVFYFIWYSLQFCKIVFSKKVSISFKNNEKKKKRGQVFQLFDFICTIKVFWYTITIWDTLCYTVIHINNSIIHFAIDIILHHFVEKPFRPYLIKGLFRNI